MKCYHCGQEIDETARHCMFCGSNQTNAPVAVQPEVAQPEPEITFSAPVPQPEAVYEEPVVSYAAPVEEPCAPPVMTSFTESVPVAEPEAPAEPFASSVAVATAEAVAVPAGTKIIYVQGAKPAIELATNRSLAKMFFLGLVTFGIYPLVIYCKLVTDLNIAASRYDGRRTMPYMAMCSLAPMTLFIVPIVWIHNLCDRIKVELKRRDIDYKFGPATFWLWNVLGFLILVGPFIFLHKLMKAMNKICENFNQVG